jgi:hypothetical protein
VSNGVRVFGELRRLLETVPADAGAPKATHWQTVDF